ncbi:MAG: hypothetical protein GWP17_01575 [Aquificales bacterium]|nr:hypothetical protein [Aquificales bacterium]
MYRTVFIPLIFILLLGPLFGQSGSFGCTMVSWETAVHDLGQVHADPCPNEAGAAVPALNHFHPGGCDCVLLPLLGSEADVDLAVHTHSVSLFWPQTAVILPTTPPPRTI